MPSSPLVPAQAFGYAQRVVACAGGRDDLRLEVDLIAMVIALTSCEMPAQAAATVVGELDDLVRSGQVGCPYELMEAAQVAVAARAILE